MVLPTALASINQVAVAAAKAGRHEDALALYAQLFQQLQERHLSHPQLFVTHSNKAASHLALGQHAAALQDAKACLELLTTASASQGLLSPSRHPHWPKACLRLGQAFAGLHQHQQAASAFEAGLAADPLNSALKAGLQQTQQGLAADLLSGKTLTHVKALPAPQTPERITLVPHNSTKGVRGPQGSDSSSGRVQRRGHAVGWHVVDDAAARLLSAAESVQHAVQAAEASREGTALSSCVSDSVSSAAGMFAAAGSSQLPKLLLTPAAAAADVGLRDVYEYLTTQCAIRAPKQYLYRVLPDSPRMAAWWNTTTAAVKAVYDSGRTPRLLLLGAKAGVLAVAALRAGAAHVTCVESSPYLAAACSQVLTDNGFPAASHTTICTPSLSALRIGPTAGVDVPNVCNCLVADILDDGLLSGGLIPAVANALEELLVRERPVLVPQQVTVVAQAVGVRPSVVEVPLDRSGQGGSSGSSDSCGGNTDGSSTVRLDLTALDAYRWTPSQALPSPLDPATFTPLSDPKPVWHIPLADVAADRSAVQHLDVELTASGTWCAVAFWAELQLYGDITLSTAGPWDSEATSGSTPSHNSSCAHASGGSSSQSQQSQAAGDAGQHAPATGPAVPLLLTYPSWDSPASPHHSSACAAASASAGASEPPTTPPEIAAAAATGPSTDPVSLTTPSRPVFKAPPSQQPAVCWLPGGLPVSAGDIFPVVASHNTVRCLFTLQEADYSFLFHQEPSFPHSHFSMISDTQRLQAYAAALRAALARAAAAQKQEQRALGDTGTAPVHSADQGSMSAGQGQLAGGGTDPERLDLTVLDIGCGSGVLSLLAAAALSSPRSHSPAHTAAVPAEQAVLDHSPAADSVDAVGLTATAAAADATPVEHNVSVVGVELTAPLAAVAQRAVAANGAAGAVSIVQADAGSCRRGQQVPPGGVDVIVLDLFDAGLVGHGVLGLVEAAKASLAAEGAQVVPASATLYCMGVQLLTINSWGRSDSGDAAQQQRQQQEEVRAQEDAGSVNLRALDAYRWSDEPDTVLLHQLPHKPLTAPVKLGDFDFCAPAGTPYPKEMQARLEAAASGRLDALVVWFDLHLAEGVTVTSAPVGYTTGGRTSNSSAHHAHQQQHWGQALHYLDAVLSVSPGDEVQLGALREGPRLSFAVLDAARPNSSYSSGSAPASQDATVSSGSCNGESSTPAGAAAGSTQQEQEAAGSAGVLMHPAPWPPWLRPGAGIEDPAVWSVKKCQQLLGQMLLRAAGAKFPPIWKDLQLMQLHAGSLGLCAATVGVVTQELTMREALAVAGQQQLMVSPFALAEAAGMQPPVVWR